MNRLRDIAADYKAAHIEQYAALTAAGRDDEADRVAAILREQYGHDVDAMTPARKRPASKAPSRTVAPKPGDTTTPKGEQEKEIRNG